MASGADTHTHTYIRTEVILRNQARAACGRRAPGLTNKQRRAPKTFLMEEGVYKACAENSCHGYQTTLGQ